MTTKKEPADLPDPLTTPLTLEEYAQFDERWPDMFRMLKKAYTELFEKYAETKDENARAQLMFQMQCIHSTCKLKASIFAMKGDVEQIIAERFTFLRAIACIIKDRFKRSGMVRISPSTWDKLHPKFSIDIVPQKDGGCEIIFKEPVAGLSQGGIVLPEVMPETLEELGI